MRIFVLPDTFNGSSTLKLEGKDYNYVVNVLRLSEGSLLTGRSKDGKIWKLRIEQIGKKDCTLSAQETNQAEATTDAMPQDRPSCNIVLYQCLPKGRKTDDIIRMATEAGVRQIVLVKSKNCVADFNGKEDSKLSRYESIIKEAIQQSGSLVPTQIDGVIGIDDVAKDFEKRCNLYNTKGLGLLLHQCKLREDQSDLINELKNFSGTVGILVGSEGGFTDEECNKLLSQNFKAILLKTNILRCETAGIYTIAAVQTQLEATCAKLVQN